MKRKAEAGVTPPRTLSARPSRLTEKAEKERPQAPRRMTPGCRRLLLAMLEGGTVRQDVRDAGAINTLYLLRLVRLLPADMMRLTEDGAAAARALKAEGVAK